MTRTNLKLYTINLLINLIFMAQEPSFPKRVSSLKTTQAKFPQSNPIFNDLQSVAISGTLGGTPMISRPGKATIA